MTKNSFKTDLHILPIGAVAQMLNVNTRTLRIYDEEGILSPTRTNSQRRVYSLDDIEKGKVILFLTRNLALNLSGVKMILTMLEMQNIKPENYLDFISKVAVKSKITKSVQNENILKTSKRGRKSALKV